ncbi:28S ribosomal protein S11, mitochondrial-like isoform X2 [Tachyglossus aculeatus]|uniref:28S ribosomal protein S11, mitochondrial-like isoform X2 n=1 Tax=Tachyglossus aculeatus TaxID=9261 RepID=UPI0018F5E14E|nr:28S ribosomal protein S11, mitochondrial-like isoform X2 [Tachyglossus aculeatus]
MFEDVPIAHVKVTYNNTHIRVVSSKNQPLARTSCETEGFKNARKATGFATKTVGIAATVDPAWSLPGPPQPTCPPGPCLVSPRSTLPSSPAKTKQIIPSLQKATVKGVTHVRVVVKGLGPGHLSAIKGLTMGGLQVVSITDNTPVPHNGCRPRKARWL